MLKYSSSFSGDDLKHKKRYYIHLKLEFWSIKIITGDVIYTSRYNVITDESSLGENFSNCYKTSKGCPFSSLVPKEKQRPLLCLVVSIVFQERNGYHYPSCCNLPSPIGTSINTIPKVI